MKKEINEEENIRKVTEEELVSIPGKLDLIATGTGAAMYQMGLKGWEFEYIHQAIETLTGYNVKEISNMGFENLIRKIERAGGEPFDIKSIAALLEEKRIKENTIDYLIETRSGKLRWVNDKSYPWLDKEGKTRGSFGILTDISSRKEAETEIISQKNISEQFFSNSPLAIVHIDPDGNIIRVNSSFEKIFGFTMTEVIGENLDELIVPAELKSEALSFYSNCIKGLAVSGVSIRMKKDKSVLFVSIAGVPIKVNGELAGLYAMYIDLTMQKLAEEALIKARDEAEESSRLKTAFLHDISHEIRIPMNAIVGFCTLLSDPDQPRGSQQSFIDTIVQSSNHLLAIINDIVEISNIESNNVKIVRNEVDLNSVLTDIYGYSDLKAKDKNIGLSIKNDVSGESVTIITDRTKLSQILSNLVSNAIKFTQTGKVEYGYTYKNNFVEFFVSDTGIGIPQEYLSKIFERFFQVESSYSRQYEGTGLGLAISKAYVELLGGNIRVTSEPGKGSTFYFTIPYDKAGNADIPADTSEPAVIPVINKRKTILVAEDIESNYNLIKYFLSSLNADLIWAINGQEAVDTFNSNRNIDLILMDIRMPVMDGYTAVKQIRLKNKVIPIIAQTAFSDETWKVLESGCNAFIIKPLNKNQLITIVREYL